MALIELRNLSKTYDLGEVKVTALKEVSLDIQEGRVCRPYRPVRLR